MSSIVALALAACGKAESLIEALSPPETCEKKPWYEDKDGDGFGTAAQAVESCEAPEGWVADATDCDDDTSVANPGQTEICDDFLDNDCDGTANTCGLQGDISLAEADYSFWGNPGDLLGSSVAGAGDVDGNGTGDIVIGTTGAGEDGAAFVVYSPYDDDEEAGISYAVLEGAEDEESFTSSRAGFAVAGPGDMDGDSYNDVAVSAPFLSTDSRDDVGAIYFAYGPVRDMSLTDGGAAMWRGESEGDWAGYSLAAAGDVNNDGLADVVIGSYESDRGGDRAGSAYLFHGPADKGGSVASADAILVGEHDYDVAGMAVAGAGDGDGDGFDDVLVGARGEDAGGSLAGAAYLVRGPVEGVASLATADAKFIGEKSVDKAGYAVSSGDIDGDGYADSIVGAADESSGSTFAGATYVVYGPAKGVSSLAEADAKIIGDFYNDGSGGSVSGSGDVNGDGWDDVLIGARGVDGKLEDYGAAYLVYGPANGTIDLATGTRTMLMGFEPGAHAGEAVAIAPDLTNDGFDDVLVGAPVAGVDVWSDGEPLHWYQGAVYVFEGGGM